MKKHFVSLPLLTALLLVPTCSRAQTLKELFSKDGISKAVSAVTGHKDPISMVGTWNYSSSAIELKSDNLLKKAGGAVAASAAESKMDEELSKIGIKEGTMNFTFKADSTFTSTVGKRTLSGTYSYDATASKVSLKYFKLLTMQAKVNYSANSMELLFDADKLLKLIIFIGSKSSSTMTKTVTSLAKGYDGMLLGFELKK